jgi:hypothetical protein
VTVAARVFTLFAVVGAPLAWVAQLVLGYSFEEAACAPGDGKAVWGLGVRGVHIAVGAGAFAIAVGALVAALLVRENGVAGELEAPERRFLGSFGVVGAFLFAFTIVLTAVGSTVLATCHGG